jgi:hypothetical protein
LYEKFPKLKMNAIDKTVDDSALPKTRGKRKREGVSKLSRGDPSEAIFWSHVEEACNPP